MSVPLVVVGIKFFFLFCFFGFRKSVISCTKRTMQSNKGDLSGDERPALNQWDSKQVAHSQNS